MQKYVYSDLNKSNSNLSTDSLEVKDCNINNKIYDRQNNKLNLKCINKKSNVKSVANSSKSNTEDETSVPFYSGELSLSEIQKLQKNARKKIIICGKSNSNNKKYKNNNIINMFNENELKIELNCLSIPTSSSVKSGYTKNNVQSASNSLRTCRSLTRKNSTNIRERERSVSYLEQYKKRLELKNKTQNLHKTDSVCSTGNSTNRSPISVIDLSSDTYSKCYTNCDCDENESFYQNIIQNGCKDHSSPRNIDFIYNRSITSNKTSSDIDISFNEEKIHSDDNSKMKSKCEKTDNVNKKERRRKSAKAVLIPVRFGTLGPDTEKTKPKLEAFLKRKEYGNNVSCKNRIEVLQRRETHSFKAIIPPQERSEVPVPVVTYSLVPNIHVEENKIKNKTKNSTITQLKENKETVVNTKKKNNTNMFGTNRTKQNNNEKMSDNTTQLLLQRHQLEKKLAENIRNQLSKK